MDASPAPPPASSAARGDLLARLRGASDYADRARAALALAQVRPTRREPPRPWSRRCATRAPRSRRRPPSRSPITEAKLPSQLPPAVVLENREGYFSSETRASSVRALGTLLPADHGAPIAAAVADLDALVSLAAIAALAERDESTSAGALLGVLENRAGYYLPLTRQAAARALLRLHHWDRDRLRGVLETGNMTRPYAKLLSSAKASAAN